MNDRDKGIVEKIIKYIDDINDYIDGVEFDSFMLDSKTKAATAFALGQIGELAREIQTSTIEENSHVPWKSMRGMRNRIVHDYENVDLKILWKTVSTDLPLLKNQLQELLNVKPPEGTE